MSANRHSPVTGPEPSGMRTTVTFEGNLADDPQVRFTTSDQQRTEIAEPVNRAGKNTDGE